MTLTQQIITIAVVAAATQLTRFLPFFLIPASKPVPAYLRYLGRVLPPAVFGMLIVYCLKGVPTSASHGLPELIAIGVVVVLHLTLKRTLVSIAAGTVVYMLLVQLVF